MQFFKIDKTQPAVNPQTDFLTVSNANPLVKRVLKDACYDCHSHEVTYPWYTNIAPFSHWIAGHIRNGQGNINFSTWGNYPTSKQKHKIEECIEVLENNRMPPASYKLMHPEAKMTAQEKGELIAFFRGL